MNNDYLEKKDRFKKVSIWPRFISKFIDFFFIIVLATFFYPLGIFAGAIYLMLSDSIQSGQSVGKKIFGLSVISLTNGNPCGFHQSAVRNLPFLIPLLIAIIPLWGWFLGAFVFVLISILEFYLILKLDSGHRLGDVMADTAVIRNTSNVNVISTKSKSWFKD